MSFFSFRADLTSALDRWATLFKKHTEPISKYLSGQKHRRCASSTIDEDISDLRQFAQHKLLCDNDVTRPHDKYDKECRIAVVSCRLDPTFGRVSRRTVQDTANKMVASYMATLYGVPQHRDYLLVVWPSEPILADAATRQLRNWERTTSLVDILGEALEGDLLDLGETAEVVGRALFTMARDKAASQEYGGDVCTRPVPVVKFFECLLATDVSTAFRKSEVCGHSHAPNDSMEACFAESLVNFTHWFRWKGPVTIDAVRLAFFRSAALIAKRGQANYDLIIPILKNKKRERGLFDLVNFTVVMIQVRRRIDNGSPSSSANTIHHLYVESSSVLQIEEKDPAQMEDSADEQYENWPFIAFDMELACKGTDNSDVLHHRISKPSSHSMVTRQATRRDFGYYGLTVYGCDADAYKVLEGQDRDRNTLVKMLQTEPTSIFQQRDSGLAKANQQAAEQMLPSTHAFKGRRRK